MTEPIPGDWFRGNLRRASGSTKSRYVVVGGWNTAFGVVLFAVLLHLLADRLAYGWVLLICQVLAVLQAHWAQRRFVWRSQEPFWSELTRFSTVYIAAYVTNLALLVLFVEVLGRPVLESQLIVTILLVIATYSVNRRWTFRG